MSGLFPRMLVMAIACSVALEVSSAAVEAQLSNSRWPMLGHDSHHTGQSDLLGPKFVGAPAAHQVADLQLSDKIKMFPVVGPGGVVYVGMGWEFCAINPVDVTADGDPVMTQKWCAPTVGDVSSSAAAVDANGFIYFGDRDNSVYKYSPDGVRIWRYSNCHEGDHHASPAIGTDGTVYFAFSQNCDGNGAITAIRSNIDNPSHPQFIKWKLAVGQFATTSSPAITTDPTDGRPVLIMGFADSAVRAIKDNGTSAAIIWKTTIPPGVGSISASPVLGPDGTVYIGTYTAMYALNARTGQVKWAFPVSPGILDSTAALSRDGTLYFVSRDGNRRTVYAINPAAVTPADPEAGLLWTYGPIVASQSTAGGFPVIGADGVIYVGMGSGVYALEPSGTLLWSFLTQNGIISSPVLGHPKPPSPAATPGQSGTAVLYIGSQDHNVYALTDFRAGSNTFADVPTTHFAFPWIEALFAQGLTGGCGTDPLRYCPELPVTRAEMAVFLVRGMHGSAFRPPAGTGDLFDDVPAGHPYAAWIEQLADDGVTAGCAADRYCPDEVVTRDQMATFLLRARFDAGYVPPPATGTRFIDVPIGHPFSRWIEQLSREGITAGCSHDRYCPDDAVTRAQMAVFLVRALDIPF